MNDFEIIKRTGTGTTNESITIVEFTRKTPGVEGRAFFPNSPCGKRVSLEREARLLEIVMSGSTYLIGSNWSTRERRREREQNEGWFWEFDV